MPVGCSTIVKNFGRTLVFSFLIEGSVLIAIFACFRIVAQDWGEQGFGEWVILRRVLALVVPIITIGCEVAIPRFISISLSANASGRYEGYLWAPLILFGPLLATFILLCELFPRVAVRFLFGTEDLAHLLGPFMFMTSGLVLTVIAIAYLRGELLIMKANLIYLLTSGFAPLFLLLLVDGPITEIATKLGLTLVIASGLVIYFKLSHTWPGRVTVIRSAKVLLPYGGTRMLNAVLLMALSAIPVIVVTARSGVEAAGYLGFSLSLLVMAGSITAPIGAILLPVASRLANEGSLHILRPSKGAGVAALLLTLLVGIFAPLWGQLVSLLVFGRQIILFETLCNIVAWAIVPYMYYMLTRHILDASSTRATNTNNALVACAFFLVALGASEILLKDYEPALRTAVAYTGAIAVLAILTAIRLKSAFQIRTVMI